jgi:hypothetical protein
VAQPCRLLSDARPQSSPASFFTATWLILKPCFAMRSATAHHKEVRGLLSDERFSVDSTQVAAWASMKSFRAKDSRGRNGERDFHGETRSNDTHASTTDPEARLYRKGKGKEAKLSYIGNALTENHHGLVVEAELGTATGTIEREAAMTMVVPHSPGSRSARLPVHPPRQRCHRAAQRDDRTMFQGLSTSCVAGFGGSSSNGPTGYLDASRCSPSTTRAMRPAGSASPAVPRGAGRRGRPDPYRLATDELLLAVPPAMDCERRTQCSPSCT